MRLRLPLILAFAGIALVFYLSWLPQPKLSLTWFIPDWLATWADSGNNATIRTGVPFIFLGIVTGAWLSLKNYAWYIWLAAWFGLMVVVIFAEVGQLFLPHRSFDWWDVAWGVAGAIVGLIIFFTTATIVYFIKVLYKRRREF